MMVRHWMDYLREEHEEMLDLAEKIEKLLDIASKNDFSEHKKVLSDLRLLDHHLTGIIEHCHAPDRLVEFDFYQHLPAAKLARIAEEHRRLREVVASFREELKCANPDRMMAMIIPGMDVARLLRDHIDFESELFDRTSRRGEMHSKGTAMKHATKRISAKKRGSVRKHKTPNGMVPYTLESHPELQ